MQNKKRIALINFVFLLLVARGWDRSNIFAVLNSGL